MLRDTNHAARRQFETAAQHTDACSALPACLPMCLPMCLPSSSPPPACSIPPCLHAGLKRYFHSKRGEGLLSAQGLRILDHASDLAADQAHHPLVRDSQAS